jgi:anti-sigma factor ChrR (cupin superfamily)
LTAGADVGLVRFPPGLQFPPHGHGEREEYVVIEGEVLDSSGRVEAVGDVLQNGGEVVHSFVVGPEGCVFAITLRGGLEFVAG